MCQVIFIKNNKKDIREALGLEPRTRRHKGVFFQLNYTSKTLHSCFLSGKYCKIIHYILKLINIISN